jgi:histidine ammonia-lyase
VSVSRGVESHASLAPIAVRRAGETLRALEVVIAVELVVAVRALRMAGREPVGTGTRPLFATAAAILSPELADRPLHPDVEAARVLVTSWSRPEFSTEGAG